MNDLKLFKDKVTENVTLYEILLMLSVKHLKNIIYFMKLKKVVKEKKELIAIIVKELPTAVKRYLKSFDSERYLLCRRIIDNNGVLYDFDISDKKIYALMQLGIVFPGLIGGNRALVIPHEILNVIKNMNGREITDKIQYNTEIINKIHGMLYYYGYMSLDDIFELIVKRRTADSIENLFVLDTIYQAVFYYDRIRPEGMGFKNKNLFNTELLIELQKSIMANRAYRVYAKDKLDKAGCHDFMEWTPDMNKLKQFLIKDGGISRDRAHEEVIQTWYDFNNGVDPESVCLLYTEKYFDNKREDIIEALVFKIMQMFLTMPSWLLKGYSLDELIRLEGKAC